MSPEGSVSLSLEMVIADVGRNVTFSCSVQGGPDNEYQWWHNGGNLIGETNTILTIGNIDAVNGGNYTCVVSNAAGNYSATATLYVVPTIVTQPADILTRNGTVVNFSCEAESFPAPEYQWDKFDKTMGTFIRVVSDSALQPPKGERGIRMFSEMQNVSSQYIDPSNVAISRYFDMRFQESTHQLPKIIN